MNTKGCAWERNAALCPRSMASRCCGCPERVPGSTIILNQKQSSLSGLEGGQRVEAAYVKRAPVGPDLGCTLRNSWCRNATGVARHEADHVGHLEGPHSPRYLRVDEEARGVLLKR
eukprot:scaffold420_cov404-Prasinococcus_capsulatus_cf.AAC.8